jgi:hypothetical protein
MLAATPIDSFRLMCQCYEKTGGHVQRIDTPALLAPDEFDAMMLEFDQAGEWMLEQLRLKRSAPETRPHDEADLP